MIGKFDGIKLIVELGDWLPPFGPWTVRLIYDNEVAAKYWLRGPGLSNGSVIFTKTKTKGYRKVDIEIDMVTGILFRVYPHKDADQEVIAKLKRDFDKACSHNIEMVGT